MPFSTIRRWSAVLAMLGLHYNSFPTSAWLSHGAVPPMPTSEHRPPATFWTTTWLPLRILMRRSSAS